MPRGGLGGWEEAQESKGRLSWLGRSSRGKESPRRIKRGLQEGQESPKGVLGENQLLLLHKLKVKCTRRSYQECKSQPVLKKRLTNGRRNFIIILKLVRSDLYAKLVRNDLYTDRL